MRSKLRPSAREISNDVVAQSASTLNSRNAIVTVAVGVMLAAAFRGVQIPLLEGYLSADVSPHLMRGTVIGSSGVLLLGFIQDIWKSKGQGGAP